MKSDGLVFTEQTSLVEALFRVGRQREELNLEAIVDDLREINVIAFPVKSPSGVLVVPLYQFDAIMKDFESLRETFEKRKKRVGSYVPPTLQVKEANEELKKLVEAQQLYEQAVEDAYVRQVYSWWTVPYWLGELLIEKGEALRKGYGLSWWGITDRSVGYPGNSQVLREIYSDLDSLTDDSDKAKYSRYRLYYPEKGKYSRIIRGDYK